MAAPTSLALLALLGADPSAFPLAWLARPPVVDGTLDPELRGLPEIALRPAGDAGPGDVLVRAGYGSRFLYLYVRSAQPRLVARDRAYQNGDGLLLVLATREPDGSPARRFRVAGFSPQPEGRRNWQFAFTWYRDVDLVMTPIEGAQFRWKVSRGRVEAELLVPWQSLAPYHPWLAPDLGVNVCWVRARDGGARSFCLVPDDRIQSEQSPRRYAPVAVTPPPAGAAAGWFGRLALGHVEPGAPVAVELAGVAPPGSPGAVSVRVWSGEGERLLRRSLELAPGAGSLVRERREIPARLGPGGYVVELERGEEPALRWGLTVLPEGGATAVRSELERVAPGLAPGTASTLGYRLEDAERRLGALQATDTAGGPRAALDELRADLASLGRGVDPVATASGLVRLAYRSRVDGTLQAYSLRIPAAVPPGERRPMMVFLHGSGQDDRGILEPPRAPDGWFELAPGGRGTSNCFSADGAQDDLREAIEDVITLRPVDPGRIVLAGFSMGGYGVYRTAWERRGFFRGLAVFSGVPDLATRWLGPGHPDFTDGATHAAFAGVPMFVFHGKQDRNCPFARTAELVERLRAAGARVDLVTEEGKGHEAPSTATMERFRAWLVEVAR